MSLWRHVKFGVSILFLILLRKKYTKTLNLGMKLLGHLACLLSEELPKLLHNLHSHWQGGEQEFLLIHINTPPLPSCVVWIWNVSPSLTYWTSADGFREVIGSCDSNLIHRLNHWWVTTGWRHWEVMRRNRMWGQVGVVHCRMPYEDAPCLQLLSVMR